MTTSVIDHIRRTLLLRDRADIGDGEMLGRFIERRDEAALAALVNRHGPMVWGVCRRLLGHHDAEDAFQATFIVLVRKAASIAHREMVGNWLYGVAHQTALQAKRSAARRRTREVQVLEMPDTEAMQQDQCPDLQPLLDQELSCLPDHYRAVIVLSDLEGKTRKEVAAQLGCPEGTVASRLVRARSMLAKRLTRRGVTLTGGALAAALAQNVAAAVMPASVAVSTIKAANLFAAGQAAISSEVAALAEGVLKTMLLTKLKSVMAILAMVAMVGLIGFGVARGQQKGDPVAPRKQASEKAQVVEDAVVKEQAEKKETIAWGKEVGGLQAGLCITNASDVRIGGKVQMVVKLRNVSKETIKVSTWPLWTCYPGVVAAQGELVRTTRAPAPLFSIIPKALTLKPGEMVDAGRSDLLVAEPDQKVTVPDGVVDMCAIHVNPGMYMADCAGFLKEHPILATGAVEFEVKPAKGFTAWGKELGGVQAGLTIGEKRAYSYGETVTLFVRVRNVSKEAVKFKYIRQYLDENPPTVTGPDGKSIPQDKTGVTGVIHVPVEVSLEPGKEIVLASRIHGASGLPYELRLTKGGGEAATQDHPLYVGAGKVSIQYERVFGSSSIGRLEPDPALSKLATGKLELAIERAAR